MKVDIVTIFPQFFEVLDISLLGKAQGKGILDIHVHDLRAWTTDVHHTVDDTPAGGGAGMVMKADVWGDALDELLDKTATRPVLVVPTPAGKTLTQAQCQDLAKADQIIIACGRYEGIDSRVVWHYAAQGVEVYEFSLGDYVLNGGEVAAVALLEAVGRLLPGMVGNEQSLVEESHGEAGILEYPVFTRPVQWKEQAIPPVILSGHHSNIARWRRDMAIWRTAQQRPDLLQKITASQLDTVDKTVLPWLGWLVDSAGTVQKFELVPVNCVEDKQINSLWQAYQEETGFEPPNMSHAQSVHLAIQVANKQVVGLVSVAIGSLPLTAEVSLTVIEIISKAYTGQADYTAFPIEHLQIEMDSNGGVYNVVQADEPDQCARMDEPNQFAPARDGLVLQAVYVSPAWRRRGIAKAVCAMTLYAWCKQHKLDLHMPVAVLADMVDNRTRRFLRRLGFKFSKQ